MMSMHDRYYEPEDGDDDSEEMEWEIDQLMKGDLNPDHYSNFAEAISEAEDKDRQAVEDILSQNPIDFEQLGRKLYCMAYEYAEKYATRRVREGY